MQGVHSAIVGGLLAVAELQHGVLLRLVRGCLQGEGPQVCHHVRGSAVHVLLSLARDVLVVLPLLNLPAIIDYIRRC